MKFLIDGKTVEADGIFIGKEFIQADKCRKGAFWNYVRKAQKDFIKEFKEVFEPL